jgi:hypothetical protein
MQASQPEQRLRRSGGHCGGGLRHHGAVAPCTPADGIIADPRAVTHIRGGAGFNQIRGNTCIFVILDRRHGVHFTRDSALRSRARFRVFRVFRGAYL